MIVLGLAGHAGSGKDSVAQYLHKQYGFVVFSFSDRLYAEVAAAFGLEDESLLRDRSTKEVPALKMEDCDDSDFLEMLCRLPCAPGDGVTPVSPRQILQWWGTEYRRAQDPDYWLKQAAKWLHRVHDSFPYPELRPQHFVNTSVRFQNERDWVHSFPEGNVWHLHRDAAAPVASHVSEAPLLVLEGEREIFNNSDLQHLYMGVDQLLRTNAKFVRMEGLAPDMEPVGDITWPPITEDEQAAAIQYAKGH